MLNQKLTGKWTTDYPGYDGTMVDMDGELIACTYDVECFSTGLRLEQCQKNARLISAAPELLALAKLILKEWEQPTEGVERGTLVARLCQYADEARAAVKKAVGA